jgi:DNA-binding transcriptional regulator PaaX
MSGRQATRVTRRAYTVLAALLLADGAWVTVRSLAGGLFERPIAEQNVRKHLWNLQKFGVPEVTRCWRNGYSRGYRLARLPADEHLDSMLACVPTVRRSAWWEARSAWEETA